MFMEECLTMEERLRPKWVKGVALALALLLYLVGECSSQEYLLRGVLLQLEQLQLQVQLRQEVSFPKACCTPATPVYDRLPFGL